MSKRNEWKKSLENNIERCDDYLTKAKDVSDLVPNVVQRKKEDEAKLLFVTNMPESILTELGDNLFDFQKHDEEQLKIHLPSLPQITPKTTRYFASGTSSDSDYFDIIQAYRYSDAEEQFSNDMKVSQGDAESIEKIRFVFSNLASEKSKKQSLPPILNKINTQLGDKFTVALQNYDKAKNGIVGIDQSAIQFRDVIEQLWGGLVNLVRQKDPRSYKDVKLNLDPKGKMIVVDCLGANEIDKKKLTLLLENLTTIKSQISDSNFGKNPLTKNLEKLTDLYHQWILVVSDIADFINLNIEFS